MSAHECWWALHAPCPMAPCSWLLLSSNQCSLLHGVFMAAQVYSWAIMSTLEHPLALMRTHKQAREAMRASEYQWALMSSHGHSLAWRHGAMSTMSTNESSRVVMSMVPWGHWNSSALMSDYGTIAQYLWVLVRAHEHRWVLMRAHEISWVLNCFIKEETQNVNF